MVRRVFKLSARGIVEITAVELCLFSFLWEDVESCALPKNEMLVVCFVGFLVEIEDRVEGRF